MKKTAIEELIESSKLDIAPLKAALNMTSDKDVKGLLSLQISMISGFILKLAQAIPTEQQQIEEAWNVGHLTPWDSDKTSNDYFTQTYKTTT